MAKFFSRMAQQKIECVIELSLLKLDIEVKAS